MRKLLTLVYATLAADTLIPVAMSGALAMLTGCQAAPSRPAVQLPQPDRQQTATDGHEAVDDGAREAESLYRDKRYDELESLLTRYATLNDRFDDGRFKLTAMDQFFNNISDPATQDSSEAYATILNWRQARPRSVGAALAEAAYWQNLAWAARGTDYSENIPPDRWQLFQTRLRNAQAVLTKNEAFASKSPSWYTRSMEVALNLDQPPASPAEIYKRGIKAFPSYFLLHFEMLRALEPRWGGSFESQSLFIDDVVAHASIDERDMLYARLWWFTSQTSAEEIDAFSPGGITWDRMKPGFDRLVASWPNSAWNASNYANFACVAGDSSTYSALRAKLGDRIRRDAFPGDYAIAACDDLAARRLESARAGRKF